MRASTAYFVGAGTVVVAIAAGLGGGLLLGNIMSPQQPKHPSSEVTRLEQRSPPSPIQAMTGASQPVPAAPQIANALGEQAAVPQQPGPQLQEASTKAAEPAKPQPERSMQSVAAAQPSTTDEQPGVRAAPEDSYAKAREADLKRDARRAEDRRKAERRQQWADKRKPRERQGDDLDSVEASVREVTEARPVFGRELRYERREPGFARGGFNLFDD